MTIERFRGSPRSRSVARGKGLLLFVLLLVLLWLAPVLARAQSPDSLVLRWTAPADAQAGTVSLYDIRCSPSPLTDANFTSATTLPSPTPHAPGTPERQVLYGLPAGTPLWFAIRSQDAAGNWSALSNEVRWSGQYDTSPPAVPTGISLAAVGDSVLVTWQPDPAPDLASYSIYRSSGAGSSGWTRIGSAGPGATSYVDRTLPAGATSLWYAVTAVDRAGNESARSIARGVSVDASVPASAWRLDDPYPNPAHTSEVTHLTVQSPAGAGAARLEIVDGAGHVVRRFDLDGASGRPLVLDWNGANDHGIACAPGVYRAWLVAGSARRAVRVARVP